MRKDGANFIALRKIVFEILEESIFTIGIREGLTNKRALESKIHVHYLRASISNI